MAAATAVVLQTCGKSPLCAGRVKSDTGASHVRLSRRHTAPLHGSDADVNTRVAQAHANRAITDRIFFFYAVRATYCFRANRFKSSPGYFLEFRKSSRTRENRTIRRATSRSCYDGITPPRQTRIRVVVKSVGRERSVLDFNTRVCSV